MATSKQQKKKSNRSLFYRISAWLHLWLGLVTGVIVVIVCVTACIWCFNEEILDLAEPQKNVAVQAKPLLTPSQIMHIVEKEAPGRKVSYMLLREGRALEATSNGDKGSLTVSIDPYTGEVKDKVERKKGQPDFFRFILNGHRFLWLPWKIGRPVVNYSVLTFVFILITGMVLWWPQKWNKSTRDKSFKIKWNGTFKRVNYDLHNVLGFYTLLILLMIAMTGMVYGIEWFSQGSYWVTSGGVPLKDYEDHVSDTTAAGKGLTMAQVGDRVWAQVIKENPTAKGFYMGLPDTADAKSTMYVVVYPSAGQYYNNISYTFDQHTLKQLKGDNIYDIPFEKNTAAAKLRKMNFDIHVGSILGLPGKILAFFCSLIGASLPITGFIIWWGKKKKQLKKPAKKPAKPSTGVPAVAG